MRRLLILAALLVTVIASPLVPKWSPENRRPAVSTAKMEPSFYRLPNSTYPEEYDIKLVLDPNQNRFSGETRIKIRAAEDTDTIVVHAYALSFSGIGLKDADGTNIQITSINTPDDRHFRTITLINNQTLSAGESYELHFVYSAAYTNYLAGIYRSSYFNSQGTRRYLATTQFQATNARDAFPCYDEPAAKAVFNIHIYYPVGYNAISNMDTVTSQQPPMDNFNVTSFRSTPLMSTYLLAFTVSDFLYKSNTQEGNIIYPREYRVYARPTAQDMLDFSLDFGQRSILYLQEYTDVSYRLPKVDNIALPDFSAGAMENWGLITYREDYMFYKKGLSTSEDQMFVATVMSHENAHFWFGNEVSPLWWDYLWLNEGFATFFEFYATDKVLNWRLMEQFTVNELQNVMLQDSLPTTNAMNNFVGSPSEIDDQFNGIAYLKAGSVIRMMQHLMGEPLFRIALSSYIKRLPTGITQPQYLYEEMQNIIASTGIIPSNTNMSSIFGSWADQAGHPIVTITSVPDSTTLIITQERFHYDATVHSNEKWWIPFTWTTSLNASFDTARPTIIPPNFPEFYITVEPSSWYIANLQQSGFYRVMYDMENWNNLIKALNNESHTVIHPLNKAQLIDDSFVFARTDRFSFNMTLSILNYLQREVDYMPWVSAERVLNFLKYKMPASHVYNDYRLFVRSLAAKLYESVGISVQDDDDYITRRSRSLIAELACDYGSSECLNDAQSALIDEINNNSTVDPDLTFAVYCNGVKKPSTDALWNYLLSEYVETDDDDRADTLLAAMGCSDKNSTIESYLQLAIQSNSPISNVAKQFVIRYVLLYGGPLGVDKVLEFMITNFIAIRQNISSLSRIFSTLGSVIVTTDQVDAFIIFQRIYLDQFTPSELNYVTNTLYAINDNQEWIKAHMNDIDEWIVNNVNNFD